MTEIKHRRCNGRGGEGVCSSDTLLLVVVTSALGLFVLVPLARSLRVWMPTTKATPTAVPETPGSRDIERWLNEGGRDLPRKLRGSVPGV